MISWCSPNLASQLASVYGYYLDFSDLKVPPLVTLGAESTLGLYYFGWRFYLQAAVDDVVTFAAVNGLRHRNSSQPM
jgi:hypothetical protein